MTIAEIIQAMVEAQMMPIMCKVTSVDQVTNTCDVETIADESPISDVKLASSSANGFILYPKVDSFVGVYQVGAGDAKISDGDAWVMLYGELEEIKIGDGTFDGLVKVNDLVTKLNALESDLNTIKTAVGSWVPVASDGGAALKVALATWYGASFTPTVKGDLENEKVNHGDL